MQFSLELWLFAAALGTSMLGGVLGMASGIFIVPILTMFGRIDIHTAIGASLVSVIACSCGSAAPFLKEKLTNIRLAILLETATTSGALCGVFLAGLIPTDYLFLLFAFILLLSAQQMRARRQVPAAERDVRYSVRRVPLGMTLMYGAGLISALLGIGSGVLKIPAMDTALRLPIKVSSATSNFMIGVTAAASAAAYFARGEIVTSVAAPIALGSVVGAVLGARILMTVPNEKLRLMFIGILVILAAQMMLAAFGIHLIGPAS
ncbi:MAG TPA: sulfite exporter TauE/SafE family protein [Steroidobacteraceae bacterium]|nr:sulfite exporter TauE/SafE family protein [Steroidobacteraceae bacterium]